VRYRSLEVKQHCFRRKCLHFYQTIRHYFPKFPDLKVLCLREPIRLPKLRADIPQIKQQLRTASSRKSKILCKAKQIYALTKSVQSKTKLQHTGTWSAAVTAPSPMSSTNSIFPPFLVSLRLLSSQGKVWSAFKKMTLFNFFFYISYYASRCVIIKVKWVQMIRLYTSIYWVKWLHVSTPIGSSSGRRLFVILMLMCLVTLLGPQLCLHGV
jgi:hypothetical protein